MNKRYLIIGASAAGIGCALRLRMLDAEATITVLTAERDWPYNKCNMADVLLGEKSVDEITFCNQAMLEQKNIKLICGAPVVAIDPVQKLVQCMDGQTFTYNSLCVATGKSPRMLPLFESKKFSNLFNFYYKSDLEKIISYVNDPPSLQMELRRTGPRNAIVIGAGLTGLEAADGLKSRGVQVTIVEAAQQLLPSLINKVASRFIVEKIHDSGASVITGEKIVGYEEHDNRIVELQLSESSQIIAVDLVVCAIGATPNIQFLPGEIALLDGYCVVNEYMQTSVPDIYAAGDCCMIYDQLTKRIQPNALWPDAMQQGMYAAYGMVGIPKKYPGSVSIAASSFFGFKVAIAGPLIPEAHHRVEEYPIATPWHPQCPPDFAKQTHADACWYHRLIYDNDKLVGFMLIGNTNKLSEYRRQLLSQ